jgi:hypothetical protein
VELAEHLEIEDEPRAGLELQLGGVEDEDAAGRWRQGDTVEDEGDSEVRSSFDGGEPGLPGRADDQPAAFAEGLEGEREVLGGRAAVVDAQLPDDGSGRREQLATELGDGDTPAVDIEGVEAVRGLELAAQVIGRMGSARS